MLNPSYLIKSRHDIYYFRYPLPAKALGENRRVSVSLKTRCPKEALRLAKMLEYHSPVLIAGLDLERMDHAEIMDMMKGYYADLLERRKARIDKEGPIPAEKVATIHYQIEELKEFIQAGADGHIDLHGEFEDPDFDPLREQLQAIMDWQGVSFGPDSEEYRMMKAGHKFVRRNYYTDLLTYNSRITDFSFLDTAQDNAKVRIAGRNSDYQLQNVIDRYVAELTGTMEDKSLGELKTCLLFLVELFGENYSIANIDGAQARYVKDCLIKVPARRNTMKETRGLPLLEQMKVEGLPKFKQRTINKYLEYFGGLFKWAKNHQYVLDDPFSSMTVKDSKEGKKDGFTDKELALIFAELDKGEQGLANSDLRYWSTLLFLYTGARRNEIASLTPDDVMQHEDTGIWYFGIKDEKKSKRYKKESFRYVPVHSALIERGFLKYLDKVKAMKGENLRLLYELTYTEKHGWGRKLTQWFSDRLLPGLGIKREDTSLHSTRHTFITNMKATGTQYAVVNYMTGHEGNKDTGEEVYTHYSHKHIPMLKVAIETLCY